MHFAAITLAIGIFLITVSAALMSLKFSLPDSWVPFAMRVVVVLVLGGSVAFGIWLWLYLVVIYATTICQQLTASLSVGAGFVKTAMLLFGAVWGTIGNLIALIFTTFFLALYPLQMLWDRRSMIAAVADYLRTGNFGARKNV
jgi:hypothetical protein